MATTEQLRKQAPKNIMKKLKAESRVPQVRIFGPGIANPQTSHNQIDR